MRKEKKDRGLGITNEHSTKLFKSKADEEVEGLVLLPTQEAPDPTPAYIVAQQVNNLKSDAISKVTSQMRQKLKQMRQKLASSQTSMKELAPFAGSSNLVLSSTGANQADSLQLCLWNPALYQKQRSKPEYQLPVKNFEEVYKDKSLNQQVYLDVVINFGGVRRLVISARELTRRNIGETEVKGMLANLTELKMFQKLRTVLLVSHQDLRCRTRQDSVQHLQPTGLHQHPHQCNRNSAGSARNPQTRRTPLQNTRSAGSNPAKCVSVPQLPVSQDRSRARTPTRLCPRCA